MGDRPPRYWRFAALLAAILFVRSDATFACTPGLIPTIAHIDAASLPPGVRVIVYGEMAFLANGSSEVAYLSERGGREVAVPGGSSTNIHLTWRPPAAGVNTEAVFRVRLDERVWPVTVARTWQADPRACNDLYAEQTQESIARVPGTWVRPALTNVGGPAAIVALAFLWIRHRRRPPIPSGCSSNTDGFSSS
jgi:hypothetical protein